MKTSGTMRCEAEVTKGRPGFGSRDMISLYAAITSSIVTLRWRAILGKSRFSSRARSWETMAQARATSGLGEGISA